MPAADDARPGTRPARRFLRALFAVGVAFVVLAPAARAEDVDITNLPEGVTVEVTGSGGTYYGDAIRLTISNDTGRDLTVVVPVGTRFVPRDAGVQTMIAAGGERIDVPRGETVSQVVKAFCGEMHDRGPVSTDTFEIGDRVSGDLLETLRNINRERRFDLAGQHAVWSQTDGYDLSQEPDADELTRQDEGGGSPGAAAGGGLAVAAVGGAAAVAAQRSSRGGPGRGPRRELRSGAGAIDALVAGGARQVQLRDGVYVLPPDDLPGTVDAMAFDTRTIDGVEVIDPDRVAVWTRGEDAPADLPPPEPPADEAPVEAEPPAEEPSVKIDEQERRHIVEWGLKHQHTPEEIQREIDDRNRQLGGSGTVPGDDVPVTVQLADGPATATPEEAAEHARLRQQIDEHAGRITELNREFRKNQIQINTTRLCEEGYVGVTGRWLGGMFDLVREANRMREPGRYLASQRGFANERELQIRDYGRPNSRDYLFEYDRYERDLAAWEQGPEHQRYQEDCNTVWRDALHAIQEKTDPEARGQTSWFNKPLKDLRDLQARQDAILAERREIGAWQQELRRLEQRLAARRTGGG